LGFIASVLLNTLRDESEPAGGSDEAPPGGRKGRYTPVARLWRERDSGALLGEVAGKSLLSRDALTGEQRDQLETTTRDLRAWLGMGMSAVESPAAQPPAPTGGRPASAAPIGTGSMAASAMGTPPKQAEIYDISDADLSRALGTAPVPAAAPRPQPVVLEEPASAKDAPQSIVKQIDDILQDMIAGSPLAQRGLQLTEDPVRGVIVHIGIDRFEGIDSVPDPQARAAIRAAVQAWENR
jgi:hypothetical protein